MNVLHAVWVDGEMALWMEGAPTRTPRGRHPAAAPVDHMLSLLGPLVQAAPDESRDLQLWLPTLGKRPLGSDEVGGQLAPWQVPAVICGPAHAAVLLANLPPRPDAFAVAHDARAWGLVGKWMLSLVARERAVPWVAPDGAHVGWMAVLDDAADQKRLRALAAALPASARHCDGETMPAARDAIVDFVQKAVDDYIGGVAFDTPLRLKPAARWPEEARAWALALATGETTLEGPGPRTRERFGREIARWTSQLQRRVDSPLRTCFRLEPPAGARGRTWRVEILSQAADDPSLLKPVEGEQALADLGRALRVFPQLQRALAEARPSSIDLQLEEAAQFLRETSFLLEDGGFGVFVPAERLLRTEDVRVVLKVSPSRKSESSGNGALGLDAIVDYDWALSLGDGEISTEEFRALARSKVPLVQVRGQWVLLDPMQVSRTLAVLEGQPKRMTLRDALSVGVRDEVPALTVSLQGTLAALAEPARLEQLPVPRALQAELRPYQARGFSWLGFLTQRGLGACLADDMGLGKTIQVITLLLHRREKRPSLLVCPTSLVGNWQREVARFAPSLTVGVHHGTERQKKGAFAKWAAGFDLVLTTYALAARDQEILASVSWDALILDEAQNVKNPDARQSKAVRAIPASCRVAMTGTPVENRLTDLWSIMDFLNPGMLGKRETFRRRFAVPIERWKDAARAAALRSIVTPFVLRRVKTDPAVISDLPEKQEMKVYCPLTREQATLYQATVDDMLGRIEASDGIQRHGLVLSTMLRLKQICDHPSLFLDDGSELTARRSGKLQRLEEMLEEIVASGDRALVFTQFSTFGARLAHALHERLMVPVLFLSGDTARKDRDAMVERFQAKDGPPIFVLSVKAGGVGLNLTAASHVFHYDRWWNPAVENQATDRAFRIGQRKNVQVHKYICQGTLEEAVDALIERKLALAEQVVGSGESWLTELDTSQLRRLFTLQPDAVEDLP